MKIYVDNLPTSCESCLFTGFNNIFHNCPLGCLLLKKDFPYQMENKFDDCPLKAYGTDLGIWTEQYSYKGNYGHSYKCSICGYEQIFSKKYCQSCGAEMEYNIDEKE